MVTVPGSREASVIRLSRWAERDQHHVYGSQYISDTRLANRRNRLLRLGERDLSRAHLPLQRRLQCVFDVRVPIPKPRLRPEVIGAT